MHCFDDEFDFTTQQTACRVHVVAPELVADFTGAGAGQRAGKRDTRTDFNWLVGGERLAGKNSGGCQAQCAQGGQFVELASCGHGVSSGMRLIY